MARAVYRPGEIAVVNARVILEPPFPEEKHEDAKHTEDEDDSIFVGPSPAELQAESEKRRNDWEIEHTELLNAAKAEAEAMTSASKQQADERASAAADEAEKLVAEAQENAGRITGDAEIRAAAMISEAEAKRDETRKAAEGEGRAEGYEAGYEAGMAEVRRLAGRTQVILERLQERRDAVLAEAEREVIDLTLLVARKVVKIISENHHAIVVENIKEALAKVKTKGKAIVKVNLSDLELATKRIEEFTKLMESKGNLQILEDSSVDAGGCVVETDFGEVDARIASQFAELEAKIMDISPMKQKAR